MPADQVTLDPDVAEWLAAVLFPDPETGREGIAVNGQPGTAEFDLAVDLCKRAKSQLGA